MVKDKVEKNNEPKEVGNDIDLYPENPEQKYHSVAKMESLGVLVKENEICDKIIQYNKKKD